MSTPILEQAYDPGALPGGPELKRLRAKAFDRFQAEGFPTRRHERWRYTDLKPIAEGGYDLSAPAAAATRAPDLERFLADTRLARDDVKKLELVFVDGVYVPGLSSIEDRQDASITSLAACWRDLDPRYARATLDSAHALAHLNTALGRDGALIELPRGACVDAPLHLVFVGTSGRRAPQPRIIVDLGENAELKIVQHFIDLSGNESWLNLVVQVEQAPGSRLELYRLQEHGPAMFHTSLLSARLRRDARLLAGYFDLGARLARNDVDVTLAEPGAEADLFGLAVARGRQHIDNHLCIAHTAADTQSNEQFRAVIADRGHGVFNGKVVVARDAQRIDARQSSDNLLLSDTAEVDTKPELEIYADDVKCSHGATIGELDPQQLFYLRARGIDEAAARGLLTFAFANRVVDRIGLSALRDRVAARVAGHLPDRALWEALL